MSFRPANRKRLRARIALDGPSKGGKTYTALALATAFANGQRFGVIDTERGTSELYCDDFPNFDVEVLRSFEPESFENAIREATENEFPVIVIDSFSHAWMGENGILEMVDAIADNSKSKNSWAAWRKGTPIFRRLIESILRYPGHVIVTMRSKTAYELVKDDDGKNVPTKVGLAPVQRPDIEYEFDIMGSMSNGGDLRVTGTRFPLINGRTFHHPGQDFADMILTWLEKGTDDPMLRPVTDEEMGELIASFAESSDADDIKEKARAMRERIVRHAQVPRYGQKLKDASLAALAVLESRSS